MTVHQRLTLVNTVVIVASMRLTSTLIATCAVASLLGCTSAPSGYPESYVGTTEVSLRSASGEMQTWDGDPSAVASPDGDEWLLAVDGCILRMRPREDYVDHGYVPMDLVGTTECTVSDLAVGSFDATWDEWFIMWWDTRLVVHLGGDAVSSSDQTPAGSIELDFDGLADP